MLRTALAAALCAAAASQPSARHWFLQEGQARTRQKKTRAGVGARPA